MLAAFHGGGVDFPHAREKHDSLNEQPGEPLGGAPYGQPKRGSYCSHAAIVCREESKSGTFGLWDDLWKVTCIRSLGMTGGGVIDDAISRRAAEVMESHIVLERCISTG